MTRVEKQLDKIIEDGVGGANDQDKKGSKDKKNDDDDEDITDNKNMFTQPLKQLKFSQDDINITAVDDNPQRYREVKEAIKVPKKWEKMECVQKLLEPEQGDHDKWFTDEGSPWIQFSFKTPITLRAFGLQAANDFTKERSPRVWKLTAQLVDGESGQTQTIHEMNKKQLLRFNDPWETKLFMLQKSYMVKSIRFDFVKDDNCFQVGQVMFYE